jgi:hypothetical protein
MVLAIAATFPQQGAAKRSSVSGVAKWGMLVTEQEEDGR